MPKSKEPVFGKYKTVKVKIKYTQPIIGGSIPSEEQKETWDAVFPMEDKNVVLKSSHMYAFLRDTARFVNLSQSAAKYIGVKPAIIQTNGHKMYQEKIPVLANFRGGGISKAQALPAGCEAEMEFRIPTSDNSGITMEKFKEWIVQGGQWWGLSAYHKAFGRFIVLNFSEVENIPINFEIDKNATEYHSTKSKKTKPHTS